MRSGLVTDLSLDAVLAELVDRALARRVAPILEKLEALTSREPDEFLGVEDAARILGVQPVTVRRMCARGDLRAIKAGKTWRVCRSALSRPKSDDAIAAMAAEARR